MQIGIIVGWRYDQPINGEGIGRLLGFVLKELSRQTDVTLLIPRWYAKALEDYFKDINFDSSKIRIILGPRIPSIIVKDIKKVEKPRNSKMNVYRKFRLGIARFVVKVRKGNGLTSEGLLTLKRISVISVFVLALPVLLLGWIFRVFVHLIRLLIQHSKSNTIVVLLKKFLDMESSSEALDFAYSDYNSRLAKMGNSELSIRHWYIPTLFWPEFSKLHGKKVVAAPDLVISEFPIGFLGINYHSSVPKLRASALSADRLICYSDYVKHAHLGGYLGIPASKIQVIRHGFIDESRFFFSGANEKVRRGIAVRRLNRYVRQMEPKSTYLSGFDFSDIDFFFYSSQPRPYKNFMTLVKAYEHALRRLHIPAKLVLTGDVYRHLPEVANYVQKRGLENDILVLSRVPSEILSSLYSLAICSVNPTLFEGGFPFTFSEAYSVNTPSLLSRIPVVNEMVGDFSEIYDAITFDPYNSVCLANKMKFSYENRTLLIEMERPLFEKIRRRTWEVVAEDYVNAIIG